MSFCFCSFVFFLCWPLTLGPPFEASSRYELKISDGLTAGFGLLPPSCRPLPCLDFFCCCRRTCFDLHPRPMAAFNPFIDRGRSIRVGGRRSIGLFQAVVEPGYMSVRDRRSKQATPNSSRLKMKKPAAAPPPFSRSRSIDRRCSPPPAFAWGCLAGWPLIGRMAAWLVIGRTSAGLRLPVPACPPPLSIACCAGDRYVLAVYV